jgi:hypothetical protein
MQDRLRSMDHVFLGCHYAAFLPLPVIVMVQGPGLGERAYPMSFDGQGTLVAFRSVIRCKKLGASIGIELGAKIGHVRQCCYTAVYVRDAHGKDRYTPLDGADHEGPIRL